MNELSVLRTTGDSKLGWFRFGDEELLEERDSERDYFSLAFEERGEVCLLNTCFGLPA